MKPTVTYANGKVTRTGMSEDRRPGSGTASRAAPRSLPVPPKNTLPPGMVSVSSAELAALRAQAAHAPAAAASVVSATTPPAVTLDSITNATELKQIRQSAAYKNWKF